MNTELIVLHDECERKATWMGKYVLPSIPLVDAMHRALRAGLIAGDGARSREMFLNLAAEPGLDIQAYNVYDIAVHHAALMETVVAYLTAEGKWIPAGDDLGSFLLPDGRLRRVVLCSAWNSLREQEERNSWRTVAEMSITNRPMVINVIIIGQSIKGFRPSPWTRGYVHPENGLLRIKRISSEKTGPNPKFSDNWKKVYREETDHKPLEWLGFMQKDQAFDDSVQTVHCNVPVSRKSVLQDLERIEREIEAKSESMRRSACFRFAPCSFAGLCHYGSTPGMAGWREVM
jgi:hypothetical protein